MFKRKLNALPPGTTANDFHLEAEVVMDKVEDLIAEAAALLHAGSEAAHDEAEQNSEAARHFAAKALDKRDHAFELRDRLVALPSL